MKWHLISVLIESVLTNMATLTDGYISYINTSETEIIIRELQSNTCYIFGVRIYSLYSTVPGDWNILVERTEGNRV